MAISHSLLYTRYTAQYPGSFASCVVTMLKSACPLLPSSSARDIERCTVVLSTFPRLSRITAIIVVIVIGRGTCSLVFTRRT